MLVSAEIKTSLPFGFARCAGNCGDKVNSDIGVFLDVLCEECTPDSTFDWTTSSAISLDGVNGRELHISSDDLVEGEVVTVQVSVRSRIGEGRAAYEFGVNYAPRSGYCTSDISEGIGFLSLKLLLAYKPRHF